MFLKQKLQISLQYHTFVLGASLRKATSSDPSVEALGSCCFCMHESVVVECSGGHRGFRRMNEAEAPVEVKVKGYGPQPSPPPLTGGRHVERELCHVLG
jgi:hypothetical protein